MAKRFEVGARVVEPQYGVGSVIAVEDAFTRVEFDEHGVKKFLTSLSRLELSEDATPPPSKGVRARRRRKAAARDQTGK